jgi:hypothetical protein
MVKLTEIKRDFKGVWIPKKVWLAEDLNWTEKMLLVEIDSLSTNRECYASNDYFAKFFKLSKHTISLVVSSLKEKGYIDVKMVYKPGSKQIEKRVLTSKSKK